MARDEPTLDRSSHLRRDLDYLERELERRDSVVVPIWRGQNLVDEQQGRCLSLPMHEGQALVDLGGELVWLGRAQGASYFAVDVSALDEPAAHPRLRGAQVAEMRRLAGSLSPVEAEVQLYARGILYWHHRHRHCGVCGHETRAREGGHLRECGNRDCAEKHFPRTDPAIIVAVTRDERILLGRQRGWPRGMYSTLAGFVEPGERLEEAVVREVHEETGIHVHDVRYVRSQPWPFPSSLMLGFTAQASNDDIVHRDDELEDSRWFTRHELQDRESGLFFPRGYSLAGQLIERFLAP